MPYDSGVEAAIEAVIRRWRHVRKRPMFGGIGYLLHGNMCFGVYRDFLIVRAGKEAAGKLQGEPGVRPLDITGKAMAGWVMVDRRGWADPERLAEWLDLGKRFAASLPPKKGETT